MALTKENIRSQLSWVDRMNLFTELLTSSEDRSDEPVFEAVSPLEQLIGPIDGLSIEEICAKARKASPDEEFGEFATHDKTFRDAEEFKRDEIRYGTRYAIRAFLQKGFSDCEERIKNSEALIENSVKSDSKELEAKEPCLDSIQEAFDDFYEAVKVLKQRLKDSKKSSEKS